MSSLTSEQLARIEENRQKALERRALRARIEANRQKALQLLAAKKNAFQEHVPPLSTLKIKSSVPAGIEANGQKALQLLPAKKNVFQEHVPPLNALNIKPCVRARIEANRQKALKLLAAKKNAFREQVPPLSAFKIKPSVPVSPPVGSPTNGRSSNGFSDASVTSAPVKKFKEQTEDVVLANRNLPFSSSFMNVVSGQCQMISNEYFVVEIQYHSKVIDIFKSIKSASYDSVNKKWKFHVQHHNELLQKLCVLKGVVNVKGLPRGILDMFLKPRSDFRTQNIDISNIDPQLINCVMPFQKEGIQFGISRDGRCLIADDMGLGKTIQALGIAQYYQSDWPLLIVCPTSVRFQWLEAIHNWLPSIPAHQTSVMTSWRSFDMEARILITSYNLVVRCAQVLSQVRYGVIIVDESHYLKSHSSARSQGVCGIARKCKRVILLSGTPALSRPIELFPQLNVIDSQTFPLFREYGIRYCAGKKSNLGFWDYSGCSNMEELHLVLKESVMIRRLKSDVMSQLPSKLRQMILLTPGDLSKNSDVQEFERALQNTKLKGMEKRSTLLQFYAVSGKCKLPSIIEYLEDQLESNKKFIIFAHHKVVLDGICEAVSKQKIDFIRIDGTTPSMSRKEMCDKFQLNDKCMVAVLSITAANAGITLTAAHLVIFAELFWNPGILTQAEDRAHRIGQQDCVNVQYLVAPGTADDHLWPLIQAKLEVLNKAGLSKETFQSCSTSTRLFEKTGQKSIKDFFSCLDEDIFSEALNAEEF